jgi:hypothetical protein
MHISAGELHIKPMHNTPVASSAGKFMCEARRYERLKKTTPAYRDDDLQVLAVEPYIKSLHNTPVDAITGEFMFEFSDCRTSLNSP